MHAIIAFLIALATSGGLPQTAQRDTLQSRSEASPRIRTTVSTTSAPEACSIGWDDND